ncbi:MAG: SDR family oxidoreductase [Elusimicrobia bacterium]|nr:SDR family oxidoreductase [Elusimicrobiota bacterium]
MKALVVGASGMVGHALLAALRSAGWKGLGSYYSRHIPGGVLMDVASSDSVKACLKEHKPDLIFVGVNARGGVDICESDPSQARGVILEGTRYLLDWAGHAKQILYSTDYVFDGRAGPYGEEDPPHPISVYGRLKWEAEQELLSRSPNSLVIRTTAVFGWNRRSKNFAMQIFERLSEGQVFRAPMDQWCNPTLDEFLAETSLRLADSSQCGIINVVGRDRAHRADLAVLLAKAMELDPGLVQPVSTAELGQKAARPLQAGLKTEKLAALLGRPMMGLDEALSILGRRCRADLARRGVS